MLILSLLWHPENGKLYVPKKKKNRRITANRILNDNITYSNSKTYRLFLIVLLKAVL